MDRRRSLVMERCVASEGGVTEQDPVHVLLRIAGRMVLWHVARLYLELLHRAIIGCAAERYGNRAAGRMPLTYS